MKIQIARAGKPTVEFEFDEPIESLKRDVQEGLTCDIEPNAIKERHYDVHIYIGDTLIHHLTIKQDFKLLL